MKIKSTAITYHREDHRDPQSLHLSLGKPVPTIKHRPYQETSISALQDHLIRGLRAVLHHHPHIRWNPQECSERTVLASRSSSPLFIYHLLHELPDHVDLAQQDVAPNPERTTHTENDEIDPRFENSIATTLRDSSDQASRPPRVSSLWPTISHSEWTNRCHHRRSATNSLSKLTPK